MTRAPERSREMSVESLIRSGDPIVAYRARRLLRGEDPAARSMVSLRRGIALTETPRRLLAHRQPDGRITTNPYKKWQGPHWTLYCLALIGYPPGDRALEPLWEQVAAWLFSAGHLTYPSTLVIPGQEDRVRRCASQEGNAIWYSLELGLADDRTRRLVDRLIEFQWPDGGWNCDKRPEAHTSSIIETLIPLRALAAYGQRFADEQALHAGRRAAEFLLERRLLYRLSDGELIRPSWGGDITKIHYPIQFYDLLFALVVMREAGLIADPRCSDARELLRNKRRADGGFPVEVGNATTSETIVSRGTFADWGPRGTRASNPLVTIDARWVLGGGRPDSMRRDGLRRAAPP